MTSCVSWQEGSIADKNGYLEQKACYGTLHQIISTAGNVVFSIVGRTSIVDKKADINFTSKWKFRRLICLASLLFGLYYS